ncbi:MAG: hypothetical protein ACYS0I_08400 [Planctomycetota bacterium]|jgi:hypothetical protein
MPPRKGAMTDEIQYQFGIPESLRNDAAQLYDEAFGAKFSVAVRNQRKRLLLLADSLLLPFSVAAIANGKLVGLAGFQTPQGALTKGITIRSSRLPYAAAELNRRPASNCREHKELKGHERKP